MKCSYKLVEHTQHQQQIEQNISYIGLILSSDLLSINYTQKKVTQLSPREQSMGIKWKSEIS